MTTSFTPQHLAAAVFPDPISGVAWGGNKDDKKISHEAAIKQITTQLAHYGYYAGTFTGSFLTEERKNNKQFAKGVTAYQTGNTCSLYCNRCMKKEKGSDFHCHTVARVFYDKKESETNGCAVLKVTAIYPHSSQCDVDIEYRRNHKVDERHGGSGFEAYKFPHAEILRNTFDHIIQTLENISSDGDHKGMFNYMYLYIYVYMYCIYDISYNIYVHIICI